MQEKKLDYGYIREIFEKIVFPIVIMAFIVAFGIYVHFENEYKVEKSTHARMKLENTTVSSGNIWYEDVPGNLIKDKRSLITGLKDFYYSTGVIPYLYLTSDIKGNSFPREDEANTFLQKLYEKKFSDEDHILYCLILNDEIINSGFLYFEGYVKGENAEYVLDDEALMILKSTLGSYSLKPEYEDLGELIGDAFSFAGKRMMVKTINPMTPVFIIFAVIALILIIGYAAIVFLGETRNNSGEIQI